MSFFRGLRFCVLVLVVAVIALGPALALEDEIIDEDVEEEIMVGFVDLEVLLQSHPDIREIREKLTARRDELEEELEAEAEDKTEEEQQELAAEYIRELQQMEADLLGEVLEGVEEDIRRLIQRAAEEQGISMLVNKDNLIDLTPVVTEYMGEELGGS